MSLIKFLDKRFSWLFNFFIRKDLQLKSINRESYNLLRNDPRYTSRRVNLEGQEITVPDGPSFLFMYKEIFEEKIYKFETTSTEPYIIDGGANIGLAIIFWKMIYPSSRIVAFEPDSHIYSILKRNLKAYKINGVELYQKGLWNEKKKLIFKAEGADAGLLTNVYKNSNEKGLLVDVVSLKPYLQKRVDFLKLDIEGAETVVLQNIVKELQNVDRIFIEYHSFVGQPQSLNQIINILTQAKFRLHVSSPGLSSKAPFSKINVYNGMDMQLNIFGSKEGFN